MSVGGFKDELKQKQSIIVFVKAEIKSNIHVLLHMAAIFFLSFQYLKQGIGSVYVMVDFICKGYLDLMGTQVER